MPHVTFDANITIERTGGKRMTLDMVRDEMQRELIKILDDGLKEGIQIVAEKYWKQTNKKTGSKIKSKHISHMLYFDASGDEESKTIRFNRKSGKVLGNVLSVTSAPRKKPVKLSMYIEDKEFTSKYWEKIAEKQERGGLIRAKRSKLLTIPNKPFAQQTARAGMYKATWIKLGKFPVLAKDQQGAKQKLKRRKERLKPKSRATRRKPRIRRPSFVGTKQVLFFGFNNVRLRPKRFWRTAEGLLEGHADAMHLDFPDKYMARIRAQYRSS